MCAITITNSNLAYITNHYTESVSTSLIGVLLTVGIQFDKVVYNATEIIRQLHRAISTRKLTSLTSQIEEKLDSMLPDNAHQLCSHRVGISLTKLWAMDNEIVSVFTTRRELIDAVLCGCFIPIWSGSLTLPLFRKQKCLDGAYSNNKPKFSDSQNIPETGHLHSQLEICPFASETDVSPKGEFYLFKMRVFGTFYCVNWNNIRRTCHAMLPYRLTTYKQYMVTGHGDMKNYVLGSGIVRCSSCHLSSRQSCAFNHQVPTQSPCLNCLKLLEKVDSLKLPDKILSIFDR